jgi:4-hydroxybenzoate polyprenyltransferase
MKNLFKVIVWLWFNLLNEVISNQRLPDSIIEDSINKPWRPLPSQRLTPKAATCLLLYLIPAIYAVGLVLGGSEASIALMVFSHMYNELDGANENWIVRNVLNACGLSCFSVGAAVVATGFGQHAVLDRAYTWIALLAIVIATTVQMQDLPDMQGDKIRNRKSVPLVYGHWVTRWSVAVLVAFWSVACCFYWQLELAWYLPCGVVGLCIGLRALLVRTVDADEMTWRLWCVWMMSLYSLPVMKRVSDGLRS